MAEPAKKSKPTAKQWEDPVIGLMKKAGEIPEYQQMMDYLMARRAVPEARTQWLGTGAGGLFQFGGYLPNRGRITVSEGQETDTLVHEVTHAAERQMGQQYHEDKVAKRDFLGFIQPNSTQFTDAYDKINVQQLMSTLSPDWTARASSYRSTTPEARAFAMENVTNPALDPTSITRAPAHIDSTLATEFLILLDLAKRGMKDRPQSQGR
jgi:hypothetical protein